jgi:hypothetical protein
MGQQGARIRRPRIGVGTTLMAAVIALGLIVLASGLIAVLSFIEIRRSFDRVASGQQASIVAAKLGQSSEALAAIAPTLFATGSKQSSSTELAKQVGSQRQRLEELTAELGAYLDSGEAIATVRSTSAELSETVDLISTAMASRAAAEESRTRALAAMGMVLDDATTLSGQPSGAPIARWLDAVRGAVPDVFNVLAATDAAGIDGPSAKAGVVLAYAAEIAAAAGEIAAGSRAAAPALPGLQGRLADALTGDSGVFAMQRRIVDLNAQLRQSLARNEAVAQRMNGAVDAVMNTVQADIGRQNASQSAQISAGTWWLATLTLLGALGALGTIVHVRKSVARRRQELRGGAIPDEAGVVSAASLANGHDKIADTTAALTKVAEADGRNGAVQPDPRIATSS